MHDLVIRGGRVVDGTGGAAFVADVAIDGDRIVQVGSNAGRGEREIDASGRLVTPGFVDIHTHLDWDPIASSSCWHGVTSVVIGSRGVTFAPVKPGDHAWLAEMIESVEDIPARSILDGLPWDWESYGEFLGWLERTSKGVNVGGLVGHSATRYYAMGERSLDPGVTPTASELGRIDALVGEALAAGALGLSSSRTLRQRCRTDATCPVPSRNETSCSPWRRRSADTAAACSRWRRASTGRAPRSRAWRASWRGCARRACARSDHSPSTSRRRAGRGALVARDRAREGGERGGRAAPSADLVALHRCADRHRASHAVRRSSRLAAPARAATRCAAHGTLGSAPA